MSSVPPPPEEERVMDEQRPPYAIAAVLSLTPIAWVLLVLTVWWLL